MGLAFSISTVGIPIDVVILLEMMLRNTQIHLKLCGIFSSFFLRFFFLQRGLNKCLLESRRSESIEYFIIISLSIEFSVCNEDFAISRTNTFNKTIILEVITTDTEVQSL